jgi:hypothetical protein
MHCTDGVQDADETDVDCGGATCAPCADTRTCKVGADCTSKICDGTLHCAVPTCTDGVQNGNETDKDCGGAGYMGAPACLPCADRLHCASNADCLHGDCYGSGPGTCVSCADGLQDGHETGVDCGGAECDAQGKTCAVGVACVVAADCTSAVCLANGVCGLLPDGSSCTASAQCTNANCIGAPGSLICCNTACAGTCQACTMALTGVATGTCAPLRAGTLAPAGQCAASPPCGNDGKCAVGGVCEQVAPGTSCGNASCGNGLLTPANSCNGAGVCVVATPAPCAGGFACAGPTACKTSCASDADCQGGTYCQSPGASGTCVPKGPNGVACTAGDQCTSSLCVGPAGSQVCCNVPCNGTCQSCDGALTGQPSGQCASMLSGTRAPLGQCPASPPCGIDGNCAFGGVCELSLPGTSCAATSCSGFTLLTSTSCDGSGTCGNDGGRPCAGNLVCANATSCKTSCSADADCQVGHYCAAGGACVLRGQPGATCGGPDQCASGVCGVSGTGHCCAAPCSPTTAPCGATDCDATGACAFVSPGTGCGASCANVPFAKHGDDGTFACDVFCAKGIFPGGTGVCTGAVRSDTMAVVGCATSTGLLPNGAELTCTCSNAELITSACDGSGTCAAVTGTPCPGDFVCATATTCKTACAADGDCAPGPCVNPGASGTCVQPCGQPGHKCVFTTSALTTGALGGLTGGDAMCQGLANSAGLGGTFMAWLSDTTGSPSTRFTRATVPYLRIDGVRIANDYAGLVSGTLLAPIAVTELDTPAPAGVTSCLPYYSVWTATNGDGTAYPTINCSNWTVGSGTSYPADYATVGASNDPALYYWSGACGPVPCGNTGPLYCFEQ